MAAWIVVTSPSTPATPEPTTATAAPEPAATVVGEQALSDRLLELTVDSPALGGTSGVRLLLPARFAAEPDRRWPVLYLLHGGAGSYRDWTAATDVEAFTEPLDLIVVMPDSGLGATYTDWDHPGPNGQPAYETHHLVELRQLLETRFRADGRYVVAGLSSGGFGAGSYAGRHPDLFRAMASFSGNLDTRDDDLLLTYAGTALTILTELALPLGDPILDEARHRGHNPIDLAPNLAHTAVYVASGNGEPGPLDGPGAIPDPILEASTFRRSQQFVERLGQLGIPVTTDFYGSGTHSWPYWERELHDAMPMLLDALAADRPTPTSFTFRRTEDRFSAWGWTFEVSGRNAPAFTDVTVDVAEGGDGTVHATGDGILTATAPDGRRVVLDMGNSAERYSPLPDEPGPRPSGPGATVALPAAADDLQLRATTGLDARIVDQHGRTVLLRGINVNQLAEYASNHPDHPTTLPLTEDDFDGIADLGFDVVRLLVSWSRIEPTPGAFDTAYVEQVRQAIRWADAHDLFVVVDMHQDAWGPTIGTPTSETCLPAFEPALGWDGAPAWATITDGLPTCAGAGVRELSLAVAQAWTNFYLNRDGIQDRLVATWGRLAGALATEPNVVGWDLLNEPNPGSITIGLSELLLLGGFHDRALDAIRAAETAAGAPSRIGFWEPTAEWSLLGVTAVSLPGFTDQTNLVFAPHVYAGSLAPLVSPEQGHALADLTATLHGQPYWSGEWGWFGDPAVDGAKVAAYAAEEDRRLVGGAWWSWKQACGDPHVIGRRGNEPGAISPSLVRIGCPGDVELGIPSEFGTVLSRSYPRAAPGVLTSLSSDPATGAMQARGDAPGAVGEAAVLDVWVPDRGLGQPGVVGINLGAPSIEPVEGGWRVRVAATGSWAVSIRPSGG